MARGPAAVRAVSFAHAAVPPRRARCRRSTRRSCSRRSTAGWTPGSAATNVLVDPRRRGASRRRLRPRPAVRLPVPPADPRDPRRPAVVARVARGHAPPRPVRRPRPAGPHRRRARRPLAPARPDAVVSSSQGLGVARLDQPRRDPGGGAPHPARADPRHGVRGRACCAAASPPARPGSCASRRRRCRCSRWRSSDAGHPGGRLLRPDPALRPGPVRARGGGADARGRAPPRRRAAARRPRRGGAPAPDAARRRDRGRRDDRAVRRAPRGDGRRVAAARGRRPDLRDRALPARPEQGRPEAQPGAISSARAGRSPSGPGSSRRAGR